jgi:hypothetical protein
MAAVTLTTALATCALIFFLKPIHALVVYVAVLVWYPSYLSVPIGTVDLTVHRIVILFLFGKLYLETKLPSRFKFVWLDKLVIIYFVALLLAGATTTRSLASFLENRAGRLFDMMLPYFAVRFIITDRQKYLLFLKSILVIAVPLATVGLYQCLSGDNPAGFMMSYYAWEVYGYVPIGRLGLTRANVVFAHPIMFGLFFSMLGPMCVGLFGQGKKHWLLYMIGIGFMCIGLFSCLSSGPALSVLCAIAFLAYYRFRKTWKAVTVMIIVMCALIEVTSNRHFFEVIDRFTLSSGSAWYRGRLIEVGLLEGGMNGHWIAGFGPDVDPGWGPIIDRRSFTDIVNHYIYVLCRAGLIGLIPFVIMNVAAVKRLVYSDKLAIHHSGKWLVWCLAAALFGLLIGFWTVSIYDIPLTLYYIMLACCGAMPAIVSRPTFPKLRNVSRDSYQVES